MAGRISVNRTSWFLCKLRGIYSCCRFYVCTACKVVKGLQSAAVETVYRFPEPDSVLQCMAAGSQGIGIWEWASNDQGSEPDIVMACCGDTPTLETLAAVTILREALPEVKIRVINVVDLMKLEPATEHPHGLTDADYDALFTKDKPIIFAFHGYPTLIHELTYERTNRNLSVHGYQ